MSTKNITAAVKRIEARGFVNVELVASATAGKHQVAVVDTTDKTGRTHRSLITDGDSLYHAPTGDGKALQAKLDKMVAENCEDDALRPQLTALIGVPTEEQAEALVPVETPEPGDVVYVHAMGYLRRGLVIKVAAKRLTVAYTTASSEGRIYRKAEKAGAVWMDPQAEAKHLTLATAPEAPEQAEVQPAAEAQAETQAEAPKAEKATETAAPATAGRRAIPEKAANRKRQAYVEEAGMAKYRNQYNAGWDAATAGQGAKKAASGEAPVAWMDGYTDRVANPGKEGIANKWAALRATTAPVKKVEAPKEG